MDKRRGSIVKLLKLKGNNEEHLDKPRDELTKEAIRSIFFPPPNKMQSILLKRGAVLVDEEQRELIVLTNGFLLCRVELSSFVKILLNVGDEAEGKPVSLEQVAARFKAMDVDGSGSLAR